MTKNLKLRLVALFAPNWPTSSRYFFHFSNHWKTAPLKICSLKMMVEKDNSFWIWSFWVNKSNEFHLNTKFIILYNITNDFFKILDGFESFRAPFKAFPLRSPFFNAHHSCSVKASCRFFDGFAPLKKIRWINVSFTDLQKHYDALRNKCMLSERPIVSMVLGSDANDYCS